MPSTGSNAFDGSYIEYATLHVPEASINAYKATVPWSNFQKFVSVTDNNTYYTMTIHVSNARGTVTYNGTSVTDGSQAFDVKEGSDVVLTLTPEDGYRVSSVTVNSVDKTAEVSEGQLTISNVAGDLNVNVAFATTGATETLTIGSTGYATFCSTNDLDFSDVDGMTAYTGAGFNTSTGVLTTLEVTDVPAGTGLLLVGTPGSYEVPVKTSYSIYANLLQGVTESTTLQQTDGGYRNYILANGTHGIGFYLVSSAGGSLGAGKAYLRIPTEAAPAIQMIGIYLHDNTTGIHETQTSSSAANTGYYTLSGQHFSGQPAKPGLYIKDGRKVIIK